MYLLIQGIIDQIEAADFGHFGAQHQTSDIAIFGGLIINEPDFSSTEATKPTSSTQVSFL